MTQWHPIFDDLLRRALQDYYDVQTNVPVGDLPREADIVVVRRASGNKPPFRTIWKHLSRWNIMEFKGRSESARVNDVDLLVEVGLGIHRRLQEQEPKTKISRSDLSFWYLANHLGKRFLRDVIEWIEELREIGQGLWRGRILGHSLWLVGNRDIPIDGETVPLRLVSDQSIEETRELAKVLIGNDELWRIYGPWLAALNPNLTQEMKAMKTRRNKGDVDLVANVLQVFRELDSEAAAIKQMLDDLGADKFLASLTAKQRQELFRRLQNNGEKSQHAPTA